MSVITSLKEQTELPNSKKLFVESVDYLIEQFGVWSIDSGREPAEYDAIEQDSDEVLLLLHDTWAKFFPTGCPDKLTFTRRVSVSTDDMIWALGFARTHLTLGQCDPNDPDDLDLPDLPAEQLLWWVLYAYIEAGDTRLENFEEMPQELLDVCEVIVRKHFGFLNAAHNFGAWGSL